MLESAQSPQAVYWHTHMLHTLLVNAIFHEGAISETWLWKQRHRIFKVCVFCVDYIYTEEICHNRLPDILYLIPLGIFFSWWEREISESLLVMEPLIRTDDGISIPNISSSLQQCEGQTPYFNEPTLTCQRDCSKVSQLLWSHSPHYIELSSR